MTWKARIAIDPTVLAGKPVVRGTRLAVDLILSLLGQGWSEAQIKDYFVAQYGDRVLAAPPARGLNWLVYLIPPVILTIGAFILYRALRSWKQPPSSAGEPGQPVTGPTDPYAARLEEELRRR